MVARVSGEEDCWRAERKSARGASIRAMNKVVSISMLEPRTSKKGRTMGAI